MDYPLTWEEESAAPWPWQVQRTLEQLFGLLVPHSADEAAAWLDACLALPWATDEEASQLVEASRASTHFKTARVMARWRAIALSPALPGAATQVAQDVGEATRLWDTPESRGIGLVITVDILKQSPHVEARRQAAYGLRALKTRFRAGKEEPLPPPIAAIWTALDMALDPRNGDEWTRLYVYGFSALEAMSDPPFAPDRRMDPHGPEPRAALERLSRWFRANRARLSAEAAGEARALGETRTMLDALERPGAGEGSP